MKNIILIFFCISMLCCKNTKENEKATDEIKKIVLKTDKKELINSVYDSVVDNFTDRKKYKSEYSIDGSAMLLSCDNIKKGYFLVRFYSNNPKSKEIWKVQEETYQKVTESSEIYIFKNLQDYTQVAFSISTKYFDDLSKKCPFPKDERLINIYKRKGISDWKYVKTISDNTYWHEFLNYESYDIGKKIAKDNN